MLGYEPSNVMTPRSLISSGRRWLSKKDSGLKRSGEEEMKRLGMGALLAVSRGSQEPARLIVMSYEPGGDGDGSARSELIALVGKGITFDSGGISIKPAAKMET